jgi:uncharacterized cupin superfamily protein
MGLSSLSIHHEMIEPGRKSSGMHAHSEREEAIIVLEGQLKATLDGTAYPLGPGDFIAFKPGEFHFIENAGELSARVLLVASTPPGDQVIYT